MSFLLDTNAISEWVKPHPNPGLVHWMESVDEDSVFISVISLAELRYAVERMPIGRRRCTLDDWLTHDLPLRFESRILSIDDNIAAAWGKTATRSEATGRPVGPMDTFLSATAEVHRLTLVTRNASDFPLLKTILNPWAEIPPS